MSGFDTTVIDTSPSGLYNPLVEVIKMDTIIAVYERGVLRPPTELALAEHTRVRLQIVEQVAEGDVDHPLLALVALGESSEEDVSERAEDILANEVKPDTGWSASDAHHR
jgi:predicted DNA-binding antitoxin AbrB/MazE fold protein